MDSSHVVRFRLSNLAWRAKLVAAQRPSLFDRGQFYVPWEDVSRITDSKNIGKPELELLGVKSIDEYTELVRGRERILCTLIYSYLTHMFLPICRSGSKWSRDKHLPVGYRIENGVITVTGIWGLLRIFSRCEQSEIYDLCDSQWRFNVPVLKWSPWGTLLDSFDPVYHPRTVFPFDSETLPKTTPFSRVWKVKVHTSHVLDYSSHSKEYGYPRPEFVALKESVINVDDLIEDAEVQEALNERRTHSRLSPHNIPLILKSFALHLTELHWAFRRQNTHYMIFPWAAGGSLGDLWHKKDPKEFTATELRQWMETNIVGLLGAVHLLHDIGCSHGDLKPDNILVFSRPENPKQRHYSYLFPWAKIPNTMISVPRELGILKITDFGTARENSIATMARTRDANGLTGAQRYAPPEFDRNELEHNSVRSRLYDVWSMGCISLEFIIWACYGGDSVRRFSSRLEEPYPGRFWTYAENKQKTLHPSVRHQFRKLKRTLEDTGTDNEGLNKGLREYLLQLLEVIRTQMLVVNIDKTIPATRKQFEDSSTDDEGSSSEGIETIYRASAQTLHTQFFESIKSSNKESVEEEDPSPSPTPSAEEFQAVPSTVLKHTPDE